MKAPTKFIENKIVPSVSKVTNFKYFVALRSGFLSIMSLTLIGSIFVLILNFPIKGYSDFMNNIFGKNWSPLLSQATSATYDIFGVMTAATFAYYLAKEYKMNELQNLILAIVAYIVITPKSIILKSGEVVTGVLPFAWLGTKGVITALLIGIMTVEINRLCIKKHLVIKLPESVPDAVSQSFSSLIPGLLIVIACLAINQITSMSGSSLHEMIYKLIQTPLQGITGSAGAMIIVAGLNGLFWWFGIHPTVINSLLYPLLNANALENYALFKAGKLTIETGHIGVTQMLDQFATMGGAGCTIGLIISMIFVAKSQRLSTITKLSAVPAMFNINEPVIFGVPIVFNAQMLIPIVLSPIVGVTLPIIAIKTGFMPIFTGVTIPWATPPIISGFLLCGWQGAVVQLVSIILIVMIYYPFVVALDKQYLAEEKKDC
ncbi:PTS transporter subunit EIIC [Clostridium sp. JN-1]|uniref:PTS sugar transporter subunit IIC n=1 Tax=Clostridium sp. JN-1 TaxID=2483110 RepID=UPI000F0AFF5C|nr:PTS transporter subunit EIIC [Clostridium sp. JN-1]